jgi:hypothetical protein
VVDDLLPDIIQAHHTACPHAMTGSVILGALLPDDPQSLVPGPFHAVHIRLTCAVCSLVTSVCCHVRTADALARPDAEDPDTVTDADVAAWLVDCLAMDVTLSPDLVRWTYRDGQVSPYWRGLIIKPAGMSDAESTEWVEALLSSAEPRAASPAPKRTDDHGVR